MSELIGKQLVYPAYWQAGAYLFLYFDIINIYIIIKYNIVLALMTLKIYEPATSPESYSLKEAAQSLRITEKAVLSLIRQGLIMAKPTKNVWEVNRAILESEKYIVSISTDLTTEERVI